MTPLLPDLTALVFYRDPMPPDQFYLLVANLTGVFQSTCPITRGGAVITLNGQMVALGYATTPPSIPDCYDLSRHLEGLEHKQECTWTVHPEAAAITLAARFGTTLNKSTIYSTICPCLPCAKLILNAGIQRLVYELPNPYGNEGYEYLQAGHMLISQISLEVHELKGGDSHDAR